MDETEQQNKLFVGGISWETTEQVLRDHFETYGVVLTSVVSRDRVSGNPRGFGFVTFSDSKSTERALRDSHQIHSRMVEVKKAIRKNEQSRYFDNNNNRSYGRHTEMFSTKKIFVGGLSADLTEKEFRSYFEKFGRITDVVVMIDNMTRKPRGFGFISFEAEESIDVVMMKSFHELGGKIVEVKRAVPKDVVNSCRNGQNGWGVGKSEPEFNQGSYISYGPGFENAPAGFRYGPGVLGSGYYPVGAYGGYGYGLTTVTGNFVPYGGATPLYPAYVNGSGVPSLVNGFVGIFGVGFGAKFISPGDERKTAPVLSSSVAKGIACSRGAREWRENCEKGKYKPYVASTSS